jgi:hypothetical protein
MLRILKKSLALIISTLIILIFSLYSSARNAALPQAVRNNEVTLTSFIQIKPKQKITFYSSKINTN